MAITEKYANFDLATGSNDGTSEANAWQTLAGITYAAGERVNIKVATREVLSADYAMATAGSTTQPVYIRGYTTTIGDGGKFLMDAAGNILSFIGDNIILENIDVDSAGSTYQFMFRFESAGGLIRNAKIVDKQAGTRTANSVSLASSSADSIYIECRAAAASTGYVVNTTRCFGTGIVVNSVNGMPGVYDSVNYDAGSLAHILVYSGTSTANTGIYVHGMTNSEGMGINHFTVDGFDDGIRFQQGDANPTDGQFLANGVISGAVDAISTDDATVVTGVAFTSIAFYNNTNDFSDMGDAIVINEITLTDDPYIDSANGDFRPNIAAAGGALLRGQTGIGAGMVVSHLDIGALQSQRISPTLATGI